MHDGMGMHFQRESSTFSLAESQVTQPFEVYVALSPGVSKSAAVGAANAVVRWVRSEEQRLFIKDAPNTYQLYRQLQRKGILYY